MEREEYEIISEKKYQYSIEGYSLMGSIVRVIGEQKSQ